MQLDYFTLVCINQNATNYYLEVSKVILVYSTVSCNKLIGKMLVQDADYCVKNFVQTITTSANNPGLQRFWQARKWHLITIFLYVWEKAIDSHRRILN